MLFLVSPHMHPVTTVFLVLFWRRERRGVVGNQHPPPPPLLLPTVTAFMNWSKREKQACHHLVIINWMNFHNKEIAFPFSPADFLSVLLIYFYASLIKLLNAIINFLVWWRHITNSGEEENPYFLIDAVKYSKQDDALNFLCERTAFFMNNALGFS